MTATAKPVSPVVQDLLQVWADSLSMFDDANLAHEAERLETLPQSPVADFMRERIDAELQTRHPAEAVA